MFRIKILYEHRIFTPKIYTFKNIKSDNLSRASNARPVTMTTSTLYGIISAKHMSVDSLLSTACPLMRAYLQHHLTAKHTAHVSQISFMRF